LAPAPGLGIETKKANAALREQQQITINKKLQRLLLTVLGGLAEFERFLILSRTAEGRTRAQANGVRFGRKPSLTPYQRAGALRRCNTQRPNKITTENELAIGEGKPGPGRPKGSPNKTTLKLREMILKALDDVGGPDYLMPPCKLTPEPHSADRKSLL